MQTIATRPVPAAPLFTATFGLLIVGHFIQALGYSSAPLLPVYLEHLGASRTEIGSLMALAAVGGLLIRPLVGYALDRYGRKPTILAGTICLAISMILIGAVTEIGPVIYISRLTAGFGVAATFTAYFAWAADIVPANRRAQGLAIFGISGLVPLALNPLVDEVGLAAPGLRFLFPSLGLLIALSWMALRSLPEPKPSESREPLTMPTVLRSLADRRLWSVWLATGLLAALLQCFLAFATVSAAGRGIDRPGALWLVYAASAVAVRAVGGRLPDKLGARNMIAPSLGLYGGAMLIAASATSTGDFMLAGLFGGIGHGYTFPVLLAVLVERSDPRMRGSLMALFTALFDVAFLVTTPAAGVIADLYDDATMFAAGGIAAAAGLLLWLLFELIVNRHRSTPMR